MAMPGFREMQLFVAAYETQSFTAAALREGATQSGVSQHIRKLEEQLGVTLFSRQGGRVSPTPAGNRYYASCTEVLRAHEAARKSVQDYAKGLEGEIVIGLMPTMTRCLLAPALDRFVQAHPNVSVRVVEGYSAMLTEQVRSDALDAAIVPAFLGASGLKSRPFLQTDEMLISGAGSPLRHGRPVRLAQLDPLKVVVPSRENTRRTRIETYFSSNGIKTDRMLELDSMFGTLDFVARTDWVTILPSLMMADADGARRFSINRIVDPPFRLDLILIEPARKAMSPSMSAFIDLLRIQAEAQPE
jgi:LysR family transcriptional regulator, nitrogen assimilation regulatory protein